jgi:hypothetical protein
MPCVARRVVCGRRGCYVSWCHSLPQDRRRPTWISRRFRTKRKCGSGSSRKFRAQCAEPCVCVRARACKHGVRARSRGRVAVSLRPCLHARVWVCRRDCVFVCVCSCWRVCAGVCMRVRVHVRACAHVPGACARGWVCAPMSACEQQTHRHPNRHRHTSMHAHRLPSHNLHGTYKPGRPFSSAAAFQWPAEGQQHGRQPRVQLLALHAVQHVQREPARSRKLRPHQRIDEVRLGRRRWVRPRAMWYPIRRGFPSGAVCDAFA